MSTATETIVVAEAFTLNLPAGTKRFEVGEHSVSKEIADHWYTQLHIQRKSKKATSTGVESNDSNQGGEGRNDGKKK